MTFGCTNRCGQDAYPVRLGDCSANLYHKVEVVIPAEPAPVMDCRGIAGIQTAWIARSLPSMALDTRFPAGMTRFWGLAEASANQENLYCRVRAFVDTGSWSG
jgi:hypothetical protein